MTLVKISVNFLQFVDLSSEFDFASRRMVVRVMADSDEEVEGILIYDKQGTIGDFIREVRHVLKILPYEKVNNCTLSIT